MLGWEVLVYRADAPDVMLADWKSGVYGLRWLEQLVKAGKALDLGGNGYPDKFAISAGVLLPIIKAGLPADGSPLVLGDDYVLPEGWATEIHWKQPEVLACQSGDQLIVEAWDLS